MMVFFASIIVEIVFHDLRATMSRVLCVVYVPFAMDAVSSSFTVTLHVFNTQINNNEPAFILNCIFEMSVCVFVCKKLCT